MIKTKIMFWRYDKELLDYVKYPKIWMKITGVIIICLFVGFISGFYIADGFRIPLNPLSYVMPKEPQAKFIDSTFANYEKRARIYLSRKQFKKSPIKASHLATAAKDAYLSTGVFLPVELALAQAQKESSMGLAGRSPSTNPFNIGEYDNGTVIVYKTTYEGVKGYYGYMCNTYLSCKPIDLLFKNFTNCYGYRYASAPNYERDIENLYNSIKKYIDRHD